MKKLRKKKQRTSSLKKERVLWLLGVTYFIIVALVLRLGWVMIFKSDRYSEMAKEQWTNEIKLLGKRGNILDRNQNELAVSANVYRVDLNLPTVDKYAKKKNIEIVSIAKQLAEILNINVDEVEKKLTLKGADGKLAPASVLARSVEKKEADKIKELKIDGVIVLSDTKRYYPNNNFLAHLLGNTNLDGIGLNGVELQYDSILAGIPGMKITEMDGGNGEFPYAVSKYSAPVDGKDIVLTIDEKIQFFAEQIADKAVKDHNPEAVTVVVMDPNNGEVLAMVNKPDFDPNNPQQGYETFKGKTDSDKIQKMWRNRAVSDSFEPGSIFKIITAVAAVEEGVAGGNETYYCPGSLKVADRKIQCWKDGGHGNINFSQAMEKSCNVAFMEMGAKIGKEKLNEYIEAFGFGNKSGIDLPGETPGIIKEIDSINTVDLATISFGQTDTVNAIQFMTALNSVANGGKIIQPHVVKEISHVNDRSIRVIDDIYSPQIKELPIKVSTLEKVREILEKTVREGSANKAGIEGYGIAGKTGTGQKVNSETGSYDDKIGYVSSFVGFAPYDNPQVSIMISIDNPKNGQYFGGEVAAPYASELFVNIFKYMNPSDTKVTDLKEYVIVPNIRGKKVEKATKLLEELGIKVLVENGGKVVKDISPKPGSIVYKGDEISIFTNKGVNNNDIVVPNFKGYSKEEAKKISEAIGLKVSFEGDGIVMNQSISAAEIVKKNYAIKLTLGKVEN